MENNITRRNAYEVNTPQLLQEEVNKAYDTLNDIQPYLNEIYQDQSQLNKIKSQGTILRIAVFIITFFLGVILAVILSAPSSSSDGSFILMVILATIFVPIIYKKNKSKPIYEDIETLRGKGRTTIANTKSCIPTEYIYEAGINYINKLVQAGRANSLAEAIDKLEEQEHRWDMEAKADESVRIQQEQTEQLRQIRSSVDQINFRGWVKF